MGLVVKDCPIMPIMRASLCCSLVVHDGTAVISYDGKVVGHLKNSRLVGSMVICDIEMLPADDAVQPDIIK
jgi:hypothetical protein